MTEAAKHVKDHLGDAKLFAIVNNAGIYNGSVEEILQTNLYGVKNVCDAFIPLLD